MLLTIYFDHILTSKFIFRTDNDVPQNNIQNVKKSDEKFMSCRWYSLYHNKQSAGRKSLAIIYRTWKWAGQYVNQFKLLPVVMCPSGNCKLID